MAKVTKQRVRKKAPRKTRKKQTVLDRIEPLNVTEEGIKLSLYGRSGTGKTTLWASFPKPILAILASGGRKPGELKSIDTEEYRESVHQVVLQESTEVSEIAEYCQENPDKYATIVLDHATGLQDLVLRDLLGLEQVPAQLSWGLASQQQWGQIASQMKERLRSLLDLPHHVVIVAQEREFSTDDELSDILMPWIGSALTPSVAGWLNPACSYIGQTFIRRKMEERVLKVKGGKTKKTLKPGKGVEYCLRTGPHDVFTTKFRKPKGKELPDVIVDPTFDKIMEIINEE